MRPYLRPLLIAACLALLTACSGPGINAGEEGGVAFIGLTVLLVITAIVMWLVMGRSD